MGTSKLLTEEQVSVLLWVKALNDFKDTDCPNDSLDDKIKKFNLASANISIDTFEDGIKAMLDLGILDIEPDELVGKLTEKGKVLMVALSAIKGFSDEAVKNILNGSIVAKDFVIEHKEEIISILFKVFEKVVFS